MPDLVIIETNNGGDLVKQNNDLAFTPGYGTMIYLSLFGGDAWWGNDLMDRADTKYNSRTGQTLKEIALNSSGRIALENAVRFDLSALQANLPGTEIIITVRITSSSSAEINIQIDSEAFTIAMEKPTIENPYWRLRYTGIFTNQFTEQYS